MKSVMFILIVLLPTLAFAQTKTNSKVFAAIEERLHAVIGDTIEEGDIFAKVIKSKSTCTTFVLGQDKRIYRHFCQFTLKVQDRNWQPVAKCERECKLNFFSSFEKPTEVTENEQQIQYCLEDLGEGC